MIPEQSQEQEMAYTSRSRYHDVDRGWAWVAMVAAYVGMVTFCQVMYMGGVIYLELLGRFRSGEAKTSLVGALNSGILCLVAPLAGMVITRWSCRVCIVTGGAITTVGFAVGAFMPSLDWMILVVGVVVGIGFSFSSAGIICVAGFYFQKWRDAIVSGAFISVGVAMFSSAPVGLYIFEHFGFVSGFLLIAGIQAHVCIVGMLCHPSTLEKQVHTQRKRVRSEKSGFNLLDYLDLTLMKNTAYLLFLFSTIAWSFCLSVAIQHLPNYMKLLGGNSNDISLLMTSFSVSNTIGRALGSLTVSNLEFKSVYVHTAALFISGIITTTFPFYAKFVGGAYVFTIQLGLFCGWPGSMMTSISTKYVGVAKMSEAYGLAYLFSGIGVTLGPVIVGYIYGTTRSYEYSFIAAGVVELLGAACGAAAIWCRGSAENDLDQDTSITVEEKKFADSDLDQGVAVEERKALAVDRSNTDTKI